MIKKKKCGNNAKEQKKLNKLVRKKGFNIANQYSNDRNVFMHIMGSEGIDETKDRDMVKLYINCERKNVALLTGLIFEEIHNVAGTKLQMKCISEQLLEEDQQHEDLKKIKNYQRNDKIVIYAENDIKSEIIAEKINQLRTKNPHLFSENKCIPLLDKKNGFIGYGKEKIGNYVQTPVGIACGRTNNEYMADILFSSIVAGFDENISGTSSGHEIGPTKRMSEYLKIYDEMLPEQKNNIINRSKEIFLQICREGNISTIYTPIKNLELDNIEHL